MSTICGCGAAVDDVDVDSGVSGVKRLLDTITTTEVITKSTRLMVDFIVPVVVKGVVAQLVI